MTYKEAVNTIREFHMRGDFPGWTMIDPDSAKMWRFAKDGRYEEVELVESKYGDYSTCISHTHVDPSGLTEPEMTLTTYGLLYWVHSTGDVVYGHMLDDNSLDNADKILQLYLKIVKEG